MLDLSGSGKLEKLGSRRIIAEYSCNISHSQLLRLGKQEKTEFEEFCRHRVSYDTYRFFSVVFGLINFYFYVMALLNAKSRIIIGAVAASLFLVRNPMLLLLLYLKGRLKAGSKSRFVQIAAQWFQIISSFTSVHTCIAMGLFMIARVLNGKCKHYDQTYAWGCNPEYDSSALPQDTFFPLLLCPILFCCIFKAVKINHILACFFIVIVTSSVAIYIGDAQRSIPTLIMYFPVCLVIIYENYRQNIILFLISRKQETLLVENKRLSDEAQNELRFMIANMAHDLKTPLSGFMNGMELLSSLCSDLQKANNSNNPDKLKSLHHSIRDNIKNLFNVNNFMTMTVNRCIDYMKASKGIKLEPRLETIHLQEVLTMPLNCMRDLQTRIAIIQKPIPHSVCTHIITDLQWFQENLFCLISNAVKYSSQGQVTISVEIALLSHILLAAAKDKRDKKSIKISENEESLSLEVPGHHESYAFLDNLINLSKEDSENERDQIITIDETINQLELGVFKTKPESTSTKHNSRRFKKGSVYSSPSDMIIDQMISVKEDEITEFLLVEVEDTGIGLSDEVKNSLFAPFKQAQRRTGGTGLGLFSLAKRVDALGGFYGVTDRRDGQQGCMFWFAIPYRPDVGASMAMLSKSSSRRFVPDSSESEMKRTVVDKPAKRDRELEPTTRISPSSCPSMEAPTPEKLRILLVDDSMTILKMTSNLLKKQGHIVDQEENGAEALKAIENSRINNTPYDVVLMDLNMPVMDGLEATKRLRDKEKLNPNSKERQLIFAFSANSDRSTMMEAMEAGADDFMSKPFSIQTFNEMYMKRNEKELILGQGEGGEVVHTSELGG